MKIRRNMIVAMMITFCFTASMFMIIPLQAAHKPYDPWLDYDDDGFIGLPELTKLAAVYNTFGPPINKTELLYDVNDTFTALLSQIDSLNSTITTMQAQVSALEGNNSVTNLMLAPNAIPFNMTSSTVHNYTTESSGPVPMPYTSVTLTLNRTSQLFIMFSADAGITNANPNEKTYILCQATVNGVVATPGTIELTPILSVEFYGSHSHRVMNGTSSFNFYYGPVSAGTFTIQIYWYLSTTNSQGDVYSRTLEVIALPSS